ncbi:hypothetical protein [Brevibacterium linens]|uniref:Uncharacterized protein n=1 Tax=Brevibacterium linens ATCC 9172 TaxID=1255617 RepID=A0A2H1KH59_BRELN|nr:hypothetical protein [Brevibacterium linens]KAB1950072.1 hypothetical protein F8227_01565 [Brevibacterium linens ATCC 9172]SMX98914.1 hypothetical protein BLIN9172_03160 [Brevibacterium linens ATCC 9172]
MAENDYFFKISRLHRGITMLDERIVAAPWREPQPGENDDKFGELDVVSDPLNLMKLTRILSEGQVSLASMKAFREPLVAKMRQAYQNFANQELESISELQAGSALGGLSKQCAFAITAVLDSFTGQFEEHIERKNSRVEYLLEFSDELGLPEQSKGDPEPLSGLDMVRLPGGSGTPCNGIRVGGDEVRKIDEAQAFTEFVNQIAATASGFIGEASSSERAQTMERETFSVSEGREYSYGEAIFPSNGGDDKR